MLQLDSAWFDAYICTATATATAEFDNTPSLGQSCFDGFGMANMQGLDYAELLD